MLGAKFLPASACILVMALMTLSILSCSDGDAPAKSEVKLVPELLDEDAALRPTVIRNIDALRVPVTRAQIESLLMVMKDRSQIAFVMVPDTSLLGYHVAESPYDGPDERAQVRWTAVKAIERLKLKEGIPDLLAALHDRHPVVRNLAAKALWTLGSDQGLPVLLKGLEGKALENETAVAMLRSISGQSFGFDTDIGWKRKSEAIARWRKHVASELMGKTRLPEKGTNFALDLRVAFIVDVLGQHQFLFMEQSRRTLSGLGELAVSHLGAAFNAGGDRANAQLRAYGVQVLGNVRGARAKKLLLVRLREDEEATVRTRSAEALAKMGDAEVRRALIAALEDPDPGVVAAAAGTLGQVGQDEAIKPLAALLQNSKRPRRLRLVSGLALLKLGVGDSALVQLVNQAMSSAAAYERHDLAAELERWHGSLEGWDPSAEPETQKAAHEAWRKRLSRP